MQIDVHDLIWAVVNFLVLLTILYKFLYGPLVRMMEKRQTEIQNNIHQAQEVRDEAESLRTQLQEEIGRAKRDAQEIIAQATKMAEETKNQIIAEAKDASAKITQRAQEEIRWEKEQALAGIRDEVAVLTVMAAGRVLGKVISVEEHRDLVEKYIQEVGGMQ